MTATQIPEIDLQKLNKIDSERYLLALTRDQAHALAWHLFLAPPVGEAEGTLDSVSAALREEFGAEIREALERTARSLERLDGGTL